MTFLLMFIERKNSSISNKLTYSKIEIYVRKSTSKITVDFKLQTIKFIFTLSFRYF